MAGCCRPCREEMPMMLPPRLALTVLLGAVLSPAVAAQTPEQFYQGRTATLIVGFAPGGINDISARVVGKHLGRFIPGNPAVVVQNLPGAGGLGAGNRLYNVAEKDGSVIAGLGRSVPQLAIQGAPNVSFDPQKFTWLGSLSAYTNDAYLLTVIARHPAKTIEDVNKPSMAVNLGTDRAGATNVSFSLIAKEEKAKALLEFAELPFFMALPFAAPPDVPPDRAKALQSAFMAMCHDPSFVDEAKRLGLDISPIDGEQIASLLARAATTPKDVIDRFNEIEKK